MPERCIKQGQYAPLFHDYTTKNLRYIREHSSRRQQEGRSIVSGGVVWTRTYNDNSKDLVVYNPLRNIHTVEGITSNAKVWLLHADVSENWTTGNLYGIVEPSFTGYSPTPTVNTFEGSESGVQYEIMFPLQGKFNFHFTSATIIEALQASKIDLLKSGL